METMNLVEGMGRRLLVRAAGGALLVLLWGADAGAAPILGGFVEGAQAIRVDENRALVDPAGGDDDLADRAYPRSELRAQLTVRDDMDMATFFARVDLVSDATDPNRNRVDLREAYVKLYLARWLDLKFGRQVATWGTGDLIFANDLFAKDWEAFFTGLDDAYLKPPQDLLRMTFYLNKVTAELALAPHFTPDALPDGRRLSLYNPFLRQAVDDQQAPTIIRPPRNLTHGELFSRLFGYSGSFEWALYGYKGFWPTPQGIEMTNPPDGVLVHPPLWSTGASLRGPLGAYLVHIEGAAYISPDDQDGDDPMIPNSQLRGIAGVEKSLGNDWTVAAQYYGEYMLDHDKYEEAHRAAFGSEAPFEDLRSTVTARLTKFMLNQTLTLSLFGYIGITDEDWHVRPALSYKVTDAVTWTTGANLIGGEQAHTMFGQFQDNSNVYLRLRYSF